jgi:hypothetical protein
MSLDEFDDTCAGCRPAMMDVQTGQRLPDDSPEMRVVLGVWNRLTLGERQAWHRFTCCNSRTLVDLSAAKRFTDAAQEAINRLVRKRSNDRKKGSDQ